MCLDNGAKQATADARRSAAEAQAKADAALKEARDAAASASAAAMPAVDQEGARQAAEAAMRKKIGEGTFTKTFVTNGAVLPTSIGYQMLTAKG